MFANKAQLWVKLTGCLTEGGDYNVVSFEISHYLYDAPHSEAKFYYFSRREVSVDLMPHASGSVPI